VEERNPVVELERRVPESAGFGALQLVIDRTGKLLILCCVLTLDLVADEHLSHLGTSLK
jgi:hypothetical protein